MKTVLPARARPVTPSLTVGTKSPVTPSWTPSTERRIPSAMSPEPHTPTPKGPQIGLRGSGGQGRPSVAATRGDRPMQGGSKGRRRTPITSRTTAAGPPCASPSGGASTPGRASTLDRRTRGGPADSERHPEPAGPGPRRRRKPPARRAWRAARPRLSPPDAPIRPQDRVRRRALRGLAAAVARPLGPGRGGGCPGTARARPPQDRRRGAQPTPGSTPWGRWPTPTSPASGSRSGCRRRSTSTSSPAPVAVTAARPRAP